MGFGLATLAILVALYGIWRWRFHYPPRGVPQALCFHKLSRSFRLEGTWTTPGRFAATIDRLLERGYRFIGEDGFLQALATTPPSGERAVFITFDDAYESVYDEAFPVLRERSIPFHLFVVSDYVGGDNSWELSLGRPAHRHASWGQLREMVEAGATVGSHTATHADLTRLDAPAVAEELSRSKKAIEAALGSRVRTVSYPFGRYNADVRRAAREAGYEAGFSLYPRHSNQRIDRFALRRNGVYIVDSAGWVERKIQPNALFWFEEMKCRAINGVAALTPMLKRPAPPGPGRDS